MTYGILSLRSTIPPPTQTQFQIGAIGGGGQGGGFAIAPDGSSLLLRGDTANLWRFNTSTLKWENMSVSPNMDNCGAIVGGVAAHEFAYGTGGRVYAAVQSMTSVIGANGRPIGKYIVIRSDDGGITWASTGMTRFSGNNSLNVKYMGPHMCVDPNNNDICYVMNLAGIVWVTYDGGTNWTRLDGLMANMPTANVQTAAGANTTSFIIDVNPFTLGQPGNSSIAAYNATADLTVGTNGPNDYIGSTFYCTGQISATTLTVTAIPGTYGLSIQTGTHIGGSGVTAGTTITSQITMGQFTGSIGAAFTGTGAGTNLTTTSVVGIISVGDTITGTGVPGSTTIVSQTSGPTGGAGVYVTNNATTSNGDSLVATSTVLNVTSAPNLGVIIGNVISGTGITGGTTINSQTSGTPNGAGLYVISASQHVASTTISDIQATANLPASGNVLGDTWWVVASGSYWVWNGSAWGVSTATGTSTGTTALTLVGVTAFIKTGASITGTGIPGGTTITSTPSSGFDGLYFTNNNTTVSGTTVTIASPTSLNYLGQYVVNTSQTVSSTGIGQTTVGLNDIEFRNGTSGGMNVSDVIYFGAGGGIQVDGTGGTISNPGGSGLASKLIYFSWTTGPTSGPVWYSDDCCSTFNRLGSGGPTSVTRKMRLSNDATLNSVGTNILYVADGRGTTGGVSGFWRWVGTDPSGTGLTNNHWTNLASVGSSDGCTCVAPDSTTAGRVCFVGNRGGVWLSLDYGTSNGGNSGVTPIFAAGNGGTDATWIATGVDGIFTGDAIFDILDNTKLWINDGNGVWVTNPQHNSARLTWTTQMDNMQSMSFNRIRKAPAPNGRILLGGQDHLFFSVASVSVDPTFCFPVNTGVSNAGDIVYSDSDPTVLFGSGTSQVYRATSSGSTNNWTPINFTGGGNWPVLASTTPVSVVAVGNNATARYGSSSDGGTTFTWTDCLLQPGSTSLHIYSAGSGFGTTKIMDSDGNGNVYIYDVGDFVSHGRRFLKSTDGGQNFTSIAGTNLSSINGVGKGGILRCVPGFPGHLFLSLGNDGAGDLWPFLPLWRTVDDGATWDVFDTANGSGTGATYSVVGVAVGKSKPGASYPAIYIFGNPTGTINDPAKVAIFRADDMPASGATSAIRTTCTWTNLSNRYKVNNDGNSSGMDADMDVYGDVYIAMSSSGYIYGHLV